MDSSRPPAPTNDRPTTRKWPIGVEVLHQNDGSREVHARVWAPACHSIDLVLEDDPTGSLDSPSVSSASHPLAPEADEPGYFSGYVPNAGPGSRYRLRLDHGGLCPDPTSRFQPDGPHGASMIIDPTAYSWSDADWRGASIGDSHIIYELHIGTFTKAGTFRSAIERLPDLVDVGVTMLEVMPLADFAGRFGWGYDGVNLFAPSRLYGTPDDFRAFIDAAHRLELAVILDVVYNHFGPDGNYLPRFSPRYFSGKPTEWGEAINFDGEDSAPVRKYFITNAAYWIDEFHLDGLRLDATQQIWDETTPHILAEVGAAARAAGVRRQVGVMLVAENETQRSWLVRSPDADGYGLDALWNDDFHHAARVAATGRAEAYYSGYRGKPQEFVSAAKYGYLYQGQWFAWQGKYRGAPALDVPPRHFVGFIQNHDQVANTASGRRLHEETSPGRYRALTALLLLLPHTPMLFQGQEFAASTPFLYFADHAAEVAALVRAGRAQFMAQFPSLAATGSAGISDPSDPWTFIQSKLDWSERGAGEGSHRQALDLHRDLLRLRREDPVIRGARGYPPQAGGSDRGARPALDGAVLSEHAFVIRFFGDHGDDRLLVVNLGGRFHADPLAEPLVAPPRPSRATRAAWTTIFSTDSLRYGGWGTPPLDTADDGWWLPAECAVLLAPEIPPSVPPTA